MFFWFSRLSHSSEPCRTPTNCGAASRLKKPGGSGKILRLASPKYSRDTDSTADYCAAVTVRTVLTVVPFAAEICADTEAAVNRVVVAVNVPLVCPSAIVIVEGTVTKLLELEIPTSAPPEDAGPLRVTVPTDEFPATTVLGFIATLETARTKGPHWPATPPPPQVCPGRLVQPQLSVPPQPSGVDPHDGPPEHDCGTQPAFTVSGCVSGGWPAAPELALILTVVCTGTLFAAWIAKAPSEVRQLPRMNGWPAVIMDAVPGLLLVSVTCTPLAGAMRERVAVTRDWPPAPIVEGLIVNDASVGVGGAVPPGFKVTV
jgi:hypothetical protein